MLAGEVGCNPGGGKADSKKKERREAKRLSHPNPPHYPAKKNSEQGRCCRKRGMKIYSQEANRRQSDEGGGEAEGKCGFSES